jgi:hypothetical protein
MTDPSRPVRAVMGVLGGWVAVRIAILWPSGATVPLAATDIPLAPGPKVGQPLIPANIWSPPPRRVAVAIAAEPVMARGSSVEIALDAPQPVQAVPVVRPAAMADSGTQMTRPGPDALPPLPTSSVKRLSGSAWALARTSSGAGLANGGQLGGSQMGVRVFYTPGPKALALTARISAPLATPMGREASVGVALRGRNVGLIVEHRFAVERGGRDAPSVTAYGGVSDVPLGKGLRLNGYAQAGVVGIKNPQVFADGAVSVETTLIERDRARLSAGIALSGGAQPGVARLDVGPQIVARVPVGQTAVRVSAEWRQRIAGNAAPDSGPAVTVGFDF